MNHNNINEESSEIESQLDQSINYDQYDLEENDLLEEESKDSNFQNNLLKADEQVEESELQNTQEIIENLIGDQNSQSIKSEEISKDQI
ncbi:hypothetical protein ABPG74_004610 [Tetrahymena malaccensis]